MIYEKILINDWKSEDFPKGRKVVDRIPFEFLEKFRNFNDDSIYEYAKGVKIQLAESPFFGPIEYESNVIYLG